MSSDSSSDHALLTVGLTGGIACGKSNILRQFGRLGAYTIDADKLAREVVEPGRAAYRDVVATFGPHILRNDGTLDRKRLGSLVFADPEKRERLNQILHPLIIEEEDCRMARLRQSGPAVVVVDAALMIEAGTYRRYQVIVVAFCPPELQVERMMRRDGLSRREALQRLESQMPIRKKATYGDYVIDTSGSLEKTAEEVERVYEKLLSQLRGGLRSFSR